MEYFGADEDYAQSPIWGHSGYFAPTPEVASVMGGRGFQGNDAAICPFREIG